MREIFNTEFAESSEQSSSENYRAEQIFTTEDTEATEKSSQEQARGK